MRKVVQRTGYFSHESVRSLQRDRRAE